MQKQLTKSGKSIELIELLGLKTISASKNPVFEEGASRELYHRLSIEVTKQTEETKTKGQLRTSLNDSLFLNDALEDILREFGERIWGRGDRSHLIDSAVEGGLYIDNPTHRKR